MAKYKIRILKLTGEPNSSGQVVNSKTKFENLKSVEMLHGVTNTPVCFVDLSYDDVGVYTTINTDFPPFNKLLLHNICVTLNGHISKAHGNGTGNRIIDVLFVKSVEIEQYRKDGRFSNLYGPSIGDQIDEQEVERILLDD